MSRIVLTLALHPSHAPGVVHESEFEDPQLNATFTIHLLVTVGS